MKRTFWLTEDKDAQKLNDDRSWVFPYDQASSGLWSYLKTSQKEYREFLDSCVEGQLDLDFLNDAQVAK